MLKKIFIGIAAYASLSAQAQEIKQPPPLVPQKTNATAPAPVKTTPPPPKTNLGVSVAIPASQAAPEPNVKETINDTVNQVIDAQLTPAQTDRLKKMYLIKERAKAVPYVTPAKPVTRSLPLLLDPGLQPPTIRVSKGQLSNIVFSDNQGNPWMIKDVGLNRDMFSDTRDASAAQGAETTNILTLEPRTVASYGSVSVRLKGLSTPVIFILTSGQKEVDMRVDVKVPGHNPDAPDTLAVTNMPAIDNLLANFLDGVPPRGAKKMKLSGAANTEAWNYNGQTYLRSDGDVQYPAWLASGRSTSGKAVFRFEGVPSAITLLKNGRAITVFIEE